MSKPSKRKTKGPRHAHLPRDSLLKHPTVASLPGAIYKVLVALSGEYNGRNNGELALTRETAGEYGITSPEALTRALSGGKRRGELVARGLVVICDPGSFRPARVARYALTWWPFDDTEFSRSERLARHSYRDWKPTPDLLEQRAKRKRRATKAAKAAQRKSESADDCRTQPGPLAGPSGVANGIENGETGPVAVPDDADPGYGGRTPSRSSHSTGTNGSAS